MIYYSRLEAQIQEGLELMTRFLHNDLPGKSRGGRVVRNKAKAAGQDNHGHTDECRTDILHMSPAILLGLFPVNDDFAGAGLQYTRHHFNGGWIDDKHKMEREKTKSEYKSILKRIKA